MLDPAKVAWELLVTMTPCPLLFDTIRLAPAFRVELLVTKTALLVAPQGCPALLIRSLAPPRLKDEPSLTVAPLTFVPDGFSMVTSLARAGFTLTKSTLPLWLMLMLSCKSRMVIPCRVT